MLKDALGQLHRLEFWIEAPVGSGPFSRRPRNCRARESCRPATIVAQQFICLRIGRQIDLAREVSPLRVRQPGFDFRKPPSLPRHEGLDRLRGRISAGAVKLPGELVQLVGRFIRHAHGNHSIVDGIRATWPKRVRRPPPEGPARPVP